MKNYKSPWTPPDYSYATAFFCESDYYNLPMVNAKLESLCTDLDKEFSSVPQLSAEKMLSLDIPFMRFLVKLCKTPIMKVDDLAEKYSEHPESLWIGIWQLMLFHYQKNTENLEKLRKLIEANLPEEFRLQIWKDND